MSDIYLFSKAFSRDSTDDRIEGREHRNQAGAAILAGARLGKMEGLNPLRAAHSSSPPGRQPLIDTPLRPTTLFAGVVTKVNGLTGIAALASDLDPVCTGKTCFPWPHRVR
jgi:hypothetical protein